MVAYYSNFQYTELKFAEENYETLPLPPITEKPLLKTGINKKFILLNA
jgi:hypothetical protein